MGRACVRQTLIDGCLVAALGLGVAGIANLLHPLGISLRRDYFPAPPSSRWPGSMPAAVSSAAASDVGAQRSTSRGVAAIALARARELHADPRCAAGLIVFVDARNDRQFQAGRVRGAIQLDHYHLERHVTAALAACLAAEQIVVYCNGGNCEDSTLVANDLIDLGIPKEKISVFTGGFEEWRRAGLPVASATPPDGQKALP